MSQISFRMFGRGFSSLGSQDPSRIRTERCLRHSEHMADLSMPAELPYGKVTARIHKSDHDSDVIDTPEAHDGDCLPEHFKQALCRPPSLPVELRMR